MQGQIPLFGYNYFNKISNDTADGLIYSEIGLSKDEKGNVSGISGEAFVRELESLIASGISKINIRINSWGGSVSDGYSIYSAIQNANENGAKIDTYVEGVAASMAGVVAMAGRKRYICNYSIFMLHDPAFTSDSLSDKDVEILSKIKNSLMTIFSTRTGIASDKINMMMSMETWLTAESAKNKGFFDEITYNGKKMVAKGNFARNYQEICNRILIDSNNKVMEQKDTTSVVDEKILNEIENLKKENEELKNKIEGLQKERTELEEKKAVELVESAIVNGKVKSEEKENWLILAKASFDSTKKALDSIGVRKSEKIPFNKAEAKEIENLDFYELSVKDPKRLEKIKNEDPELFNTLYNDFLIKNKK
jgi:ATP-dependent protease ClpP protease subunit